MKTPHLTFGLLVVMTFMVLLLLLFVEDAAATKSFVHPKFGVTAAGKPAAMLQAVEGKERHRGVILYGTLFGAAACMLCVVVMGFGVNERNPMAHNILFVVGVLYALTLVAVSVIYWQNVELAEPRLVLGFPISTAAMLYLVGCSPFLLIFVYMATFRSWTLTLEDEQRFYDLVAARKARTKAGN